MKISDLRLTIHRWKRHQAIRNGTMTYGDGVLLLVTIETDESISGYGWLGGTAAERPLEQWSIYQSLLKQQLIGQNPLNSGGIAQRLDQQLLKTYGFSGGHSHLQGAVNCALWDVRGKSENKPVHALLSGQESIRRVQAYIAGGYYVGEDLVGEGIELLTQELKHNVSVLNAKSVKIKIGRDLEIDIARTRAAREAIGEHCELMVDANCAFLDADTAIAYAKALKQFDIKWFEEPFSPAELELHRQLAAENLIPIASGENVGSAAYLVEMMRQGLVQYVNLDVAILSGGYDAAARIAQYCDNCNAILAPHGCQELQCHVVAAFGDAESRLEIYPPLLDPERDKIFPQKLEIDDDGLVTVTNEPGIGRTPDIEALEAFRVYP